MTEKDKYEIPDWVGRPPDGSHLDVLKQKQLLQKLLIDEKGYYYFGRNPGTCDFVVEHASCSRVHAVILYHKLLRRFAMVDLESSHGTFVENVRIQPLTPVFLDTDNTFHFGASTRRYVIRATLSGHMGNDSMITVEDSDSGLPVDEVEIDNLTEYNTAQNRRVPQIPISLEDARRKTRPRPKLRFNDDEDIINLEDVDPSVGRFRNLVRTAVIPSTSSSSSSAAKRSHSGQLKEKNGASELFEFYAPDAKRLHNPGKSALSHLHSTSPGKAVSVPNSFGPSLTTSTLGIGMTLNAAPDLDLYANLSPPSKTSATKLPPAKLAARTLGIGVPSASELRAADTEDMHAAANKKKYAKEAWPGRKPTASVI